MAYNFPSNPTEGQEYVPPVGGQTYVYHAPRWLVKGVPPASAGGGSTGVGEAPEDGKQYTRRNAAWSENDWTYVINKPTTFAPSTHTHPETDVVNLIADLALKAPLASPTFTGDPKAPTPADGDNDTSVATTSFVQSAIVLGGAPAGAIMTFARSTAPTGWLKANGALISRTTYAALFTAIGTTFGAGDGSTTFALPDLRGEFLRAWDDGRAIDSGRTFGSAQAGDTASHTHAISITSAGHSATHTHVASGTTGANSVSHTHTFSDSSASAGVSANHTHTLPDGSYYIVGWKTGGAAGLGSTWSGGQPLHNFGPATSGHSADHAHTTTISGTSAGVSANHTHTFSDTTDGASVTHTHAVTGTSGATGGTETRPRNIALLACIKY